MNTASVVHCYSGHSYAQEPVSFEWQGREYAVAALESVQRVLDNQSGAMMVQFIVQTSDRRRFRLSYDDKQDAWSVDPIGQSAGAASA